MAFARPRLPTSVLVRTSARALAAVTGAIVLAACGASATSQVRSKVMQFATAAHTHNYTAICMSVLAPQLLADIAAGGLSCEHALGIALNKVHGARLVIGTITVSGSTAHVVTLTQAAGEKTTLATLDLTEASNGWRIASLGNSTG